MLCTALPSMILLIFFHPSVSAETCRWSVVASSCDYLVALEHVFPVALDSVDFPRLEALEHRLECLELRARGVCVGVARPYIQGKTVKRRKELRTGGGLTSDRSCCAPSKSSRSC